MGGQAEMLRRLCGAQHLLIRPIAAAPWFPVSLLRGEGVKGFVIGRVNRDELPDHMRRELGDRQTMAFAVPAISSQ